MTVRSYRLIFNQSGLRPPLPVFEKLFLNTFIANKVKYNRAIDIASTINGFWINPANMNPEALIQAINSAYGSLVDM